MKLYDILEEIEACIDQETGEFDAERFAEAKAEEDKKLESIGKLMKNKKAEIEALDAEIKALQARKKSCERTLESIGRFVGYYLGGIKRTVGSIKFWFAGKQDGVINLKVKPNELPEQYRRERVSYDADKTAIKTAIANGEDLSAYAEWDTRPKASVK